MNISVTNQAYVFIMSAVSGVLIGAVFDVFRAIRKKIKQKAMAVGVQDILFWVIAAVIVFAFMYNFNSGQPRWYIFIGVIAGCSIYAALVGTFMVNVFAWVGTTMAKIVAFIIKILLFPIALVYKILKKPMVIVTFHIRGAAKKICRYIKRILKTPKKIKKRLKMY